MGETAFTLCQAQRERSGQRSVDESERVSGWVDDHSELGRLGLHAHHGHTQSGECRFSDVEVVDDDVEMCLLRDVATRPGRRPVVVPTS